MRIEYLDQDDIVKIVGTQMDIYDNTLKAINSFNALKDEHARVFLDTYRDLTVAGIRTSIADLFDLSNEDRKDLNKKLNAVFCDTTLRPIDMKGKVVLIALKYLRKALYDLEEELDNRGQIVEDAASELDAKIDNLEKVITTVIKSK